jgi:hypothetical protein
VHETGSGNEQKPLRRSGVVILGGIFMLAGAAGLLFADRAGCFSNLCRRAHAWLSVHMAEAIT